LAVRRSRDEGDLVLEFPLHAGDYVAPAWLGARNS
jgi:hypothetical protein